MPTSQSTDNNSSAVGTLEQFFVKLGSAFDSKSIAGILDLCVDDCYWKDVLSLTWNIYTAEGKQELQSMLEATIDSAGLYDWKVVDTNLAKVNENITEGFYTANSSAGHIKGYVRLRGGKLWTIMTALQDLSGFEEPVNEKRVRGAEHGIKKAGPNWLDLKEQENAELGTTKQPYVLVVGGGQAGIALGAHLKKFNVPAIICDKHERPGDQWRSRYKSLCLHDPVWCNHLPYLKFPTDWPIFCPKDKMGDWLEAYTKIMELNYWASTEVKAATFDERAKKWTVTLIKNGDPYTVYPDHLVMALGNSGFPNVPKFPGNEKFMGEQRHSSNHSGGEKFKGKKVVVIGANNSAHDICADLWAHDADVTMVQRSSTHIIRSETSMDLVTGPLYSEEATKSGIETENADIIIASIPYKIIGEFEKNACDKVRLRDKAFYDKLIERGFLIDFGDDESGLFPKYLRRGSGYYINVGASELVISGDIKHKVGGVQEIKEHSVVLSDGQELECDAIIYATGYGSQTQWIEKICGNQVADKIGKCWGLGSDTTKDPGPWEGELRNMWKPTHQENLWVIGGNLAQSRHFTKYVALQLKARYECIPVKVYGTPNVSHLR